MSKCLAFSELSLNNPQLYDPHFAVMQQSDQIQNHLYYQSIPIYTTQENIIKQEFNGNFNAITQNVDVSAQNANQNNIFINYTIINNFLNSRKKKQVEQIERAKFDVDEKNNESSEKVDEFLESIRLFVQYLEMNDGEQSILNPSIAFGISRRRLYDIINVFESIGCCKKRRCDVVFWIGQSNIKNYFESLIKQRKLDNIDIPLEELFPAEKCIGVSNMTVSLILLFYALKIERLDLRDVAFFFARQTSRYKTTLNKLYQIVHIMSSIELMKKTQQLGEVVISIEHFGFEVVSEDNDQKKVDLESIQSFLNTSKSKLIRNVKKRRNEFKQYVTKNRKR